MQGNCAAVMTRGALLLAFPFIRLTQQTEQFESSLPVALHAWKAVVVLQGTEHATGGALAFLAEGILWNQKSWQPASGYSYSPCKCNWAD